jgi:hypothetical protein
MNGEAIYVSPGLRASVDLGWLQIVPGLAVPFGVGAHAGERSALLYLSFEHPISANPR